MIRAAIAALSALASHMAESARVGSYSTILLTVQAAADLPGVQWRLQRRWKQRQQPVASCLRAVAERTMNGPQVIAIMLTSAW